MPGTGRMRVQDTCHSSTLGGQTYCTWRSVAWNGVQWRFQVLLLQVGDTPVVLRSSPTGRWTITAHKVTSVSHTTIHHSYIKIMNL